MRRRNFLAGTSAAGLAVSLARPLMALQEKNKASKYMETMGLQLWTVRNQLAEDQSATLKAVKAAGYKQVELMRCVGSEEIVKEAKDLGLAVNSSFVEWNSVLQQGENVPKRKDIVAKAGEYGVKHLVFGYVGKGSRETVDLMKNCATKANEFGKMCNDAGIKLCYHNHSFEFAPVDGKTTGFDVLMNELDNDLCKFELDVFWVKIGGWDPFETMKKLDGRITQVHLKDLKKGSEVNHDEGTVPHECFEELGDGTIDMQKTLEMAEEVGAEYCHVEQDQSADPIASIGQSMGHLKSFGG